MRITVRLFAGLRERAGADRVELDLPDDAAGGRRAGRDGPASRGSASSRSTASTRAPTSACWPTHEVALIPPVSGGAETPVRLVEVTDAAARPRARSPPPCATRAPARSCCFEGVTRDVEALDYEAYVEMAREKLAAIGEPRRPSGTGCARSRSSTASAACR